MAGGSYRLDADELSLVIRELIDCHAHLEQGLHDLRVRVRCLQEAWDGLSAEAHRVAQDEIEDGLAAMNAALTSFARAKEDARDGYHVAWDANLAIWAAVS